MTGAPHLGTLVRHARHPHQAPTECPGQVGSRPATVPLRPARPVRGQHLRHEPPPRRRSARRRALQLLLGAGAPRQRRGGQLQERRDPGHVPKGRSLSRREGRHHHAAVRHRAPGLRRRRDPRPAAAQQGHGRGEVPRRPLAAGLDPARLRPHPASRRPVRAVHAAGSGRRWRDARQGRQVEGQALRRLVAAHDVRRRRRGRRGHRGALRGRRLPQGPRPLPAPGRDHPAWRAAHGASRYGQDAPGPCAGRRGRGAVLLALGLGVRGDVRRGGR